MRFSTLFLLLSLCANARSQEGAFHPDQQETIIERSKDYVLRLRSDGSRLSVKIEKRGGSTADIILPEEVAQVDSIEFVRSNTAVVLGRVNGDVSIVVVLDLAKSGVGDKLYCYAPALSPNKRFLAFIKFFPAHFVQGVTDVYLLYDFQKSAAENRPQGVGIGDVQNVGRVIFPPQSKNQPGDNTERTNEDVHMLESGAFFWSDNGDRLAFVDRYRSEMSLIVATIPISATDISIRHEEIKRSNVCQSEDTNKCSFSVESIQFQKQGRLLLKLRPYNGTVLLKREIDLQM
jgi:hypothetical protein